MGELTSANKEAYQFLLSKGLIRDDLCQFCGESIKNSKYKFTEPNNNFKFDTCKACYLQIESVHKSLAKSLRNFLKF